MLTLDEAVAKYEKAKDTLEQVSHAYALGHVAFNEVIDARTALGGAVGDVAMAVWYATIQPPSNAWSMSQVPKEIDRLLGPATSK